MSYRIRFNMPDGRTGLWNHDYSTREDAQRAIEDRLTDTGFTYTVEEVPEPGTTDAHLANQAMSRDLAFALQLGGAMREAMRTGEWRHGHDAGMAHSAIAGWDRWRPSLAAAPSVPVGASEAPGEGGDSDRRRLEVLERYLEGDSFRQIWKTSMGPFAAGTKTEGKHFDATTLADLADKISASWEAEP